jgi:hypothetical protein
MRCCPAVSATADLGIPARTKLIKGLMRGVLTAVSAESRSRSKRSRRLRMLGTEKGKAERAIMTTSYKPPTSRHQPCQLDTLPTA